MVEQLFERRGREFEIDINGRPPLQMDMQDVTLEGANTSFQIHYRVDLKTMQIPSMPFKW
ncbi:hypothetical protein A3743_25380 [Oleiphilus sp. HI0072]|nr:hypothetical protein A3743_25380 [Oleiphilus sp. HI0072]